MSSCPALPPFDNFRLATPDDLARIATVAAAGFFWSPTFRFQRPHHAQFPEDTLSAYWREYKSTLDDPASILLVAEDVWLPTEAEKAYQGLQKCGLYSHGQAEARVVVGVCSINLKPGSSFIGLAQQGHQRGDGSHTPARKSGVVSGAEANPKDIFIAVETKRDLNVEAARLYAKATAPAKQAYLAGKMRLSTLAVHPAYWGRSHATRLINWCTQLADMDDAPLGVSAAPMGAILAAKAEFKEVEVVKIERAIVHRVVKNTDVGDVVLWVAIRQPLRSLSDTSTGSDSSVPET